MSELQTELLVAHDKSSYLKKQIIQKSIQVKKR